MNLKEGRDAMPQKVVLYQLRIERTQNWKEDQSKMKKEKFCWTPNVVFTTRRQVLFFFVNIFNTYLMMLCCFRVVLIAA